MKHGWFVDGAPFYNCELEAAESYNCGWAVGELMDDGMTFFLSSPDSDDAFYNIRGPLLDQSPITYELSRYGGTPNAGEPAGEATPQFTLAFDCLDEPSAFNGEVGPCPTSE